MFFTKETFLSYGEEIMGQVNLNKQQGENTGQEPAANAGNQAGTYQDPLANAQNQAGTYQDPLATPQNQAGKYQDPLQNAGKEPGKKKMRGGDWVATIVAIVLVRLVGLIGALICFGGYWVVRAIAKSKMSVGLKVVLSILVAVAFLILLIVFILFSAYLSASIS